VGGFTAGGAGGAGGGTPPGKPSAGGRNILVPVVAAAVLIVAVVVGVLVFHGHGKSGLGNTSTTQPGLPTSTLPKSITTTTTITTTTPPTSPPSSLTALSQLVPADDQDPTTCVTNTASASDTGVVSSLKCDDPDLNSIVYAIQWQTFADYQGSLASLNSNENFNPNNVTELCPAPSANQGQMSYSFQDFPDRAGQVVECFVDNQGLTYLWTLPSENTYFVTTTATFSTVENWWSQQFADPAS
jgi:hypothetical protein